MLHAEILHPSDLTQEDVAAWRELCAATPRPHSPLLGPDFTRLIGAVRPDARVAIWRNADGSPEAFLPHHRRGNLSFPIGAPLSDYHGPVARAGFHLQTALAGAGLETYRFSALVAAEIPEGRSERDGFLIELDGAPEAYLEALRQARPKNFKNSRRLGHKLEREIGALRIVATPDLEAFQTLIAWKREQFARTGGYDFLRTAWVGDLMRRLQADPNPAFGGQMICLYAGDRLVAGHFGLRAGEAYHPWLASTDPALDEYGLGHVFLMQVIAAMPELGLATYDLGPGHEHYKRLYARTVRRVVAGEFVSRTRGSGGDLVDRLRRRLEVISMAEPSTLGRVQGYAETVGQAARRILPSRTAS